MEKKHASKRIIPQAVIAHPVYKAAKASSKNAHRYDMWENSVVLGLHVFEWLVIGVAALLIIAGVNVGIYFTNVAASGGLQKF